MVADPVLVAELDIHRTEADGMVITVIESDRALACALPDGLGTAALPGTGWWSPPPWPEPSARPSCAR